MTDNELMEQLDALHDALVRQKKALMDALKVYNDVNFKINKLRSKIKKQIKNKDNDNRARTCKNNNGREGCGRVPRHIQVVQ